MKKEAGGGASTFGSHLAIHRTFLPNNTKRKFFFFQETMDMSSFWAVFDGKYQLCFWIVGAVVENPCHEMGKKDYHLEEYK
ncbi:hypothetical protein TNCV_1198911 [Trichonephila clavipes]|uniref:Uncharacterized protein n=1 Tax=Trichonephila clavipes TaxID=2585209 RepID=A0A8X6SBS0_TRICX|nr:hypothetical protein TNCV_1198911 [Trichonephila clavipes]